MKTTTFSQANNARRAARKAIADGKAPSSSFTIERIGAKGARDVRYAIVWGDLGVSPGVAEALAAGTTVPVETADDVRAVVEQADKSKRTRKARGTAAAKPPRATKAAKSSVKSSGRPRTKTAALDAAAAAGIMPEKPIVTSQANIRGQKRFDYLAERAAAGDWAAIKEYAINSNNTQAKQLKRYQARLLAYYEATKAGAAA